MISKSLEEYVKTMYVLKKQNGNIRVTDIANKMECTKSSVNKALKNLRENKYINYEVYGAIDLTHEGEELAKKLLEAYDISYVFLKEVLNIDDKKAQEEAEKLKTIVSDDTLNKLAKYVHKVLGLTDLSCNYDLNKERCRNCIKRTTGKKED